MLILTIRTDKPEAEIGLFDDGNKLTYETWQANRQLAETIHAKIKNTLKSRDLSLKDLDGIAVFRGPGSFTGLRIGINVANTLADSLAIPIASGDTDKWQQQAIKKLCSGDDENIIAPSYGAPPRTTKPKH